MTPSLVWFRQDLRLQDNPALHAAVARGGPVIPVYILDETGEGNWAPGAAARWWLHHSLAALDADLQAHGLRLVRRRGQAGPELRELIAATHAAAVYWNRRYEPAVIARDRAIKADLKEAGLAVETFNGSLLHEPHDIARRQGGPFQVFGPYWRESLARPVAPPLTALAGVTPTAKQRPPSLPLDELGLLPRIRWDAGFARTWQPGEAGARRQLRAFAARALDGYARGRDQLADDATSRLSPHLHFGEVSPRQVWAAVRERGRESGVFPPSQGAGVFLREIGWREFAHHLLYHFPHTPGQPLREAFARFPWADDPRNEKLKAWQRGRTGYPVVDAAMRQLWATGWMHNRARMIVASFLVKHLRLPWQRGAEWFWDTLVDADLANNTLGWQWSAGCGADAAPYFRIFAPVLQGQKFDAEGAYVRRWVPELARLPAKYLHAPWTAPAAVLQAAGVVWGENYPRPIVDHATARAEALAAFQSLRAAGTAA